MNGLDHLIHLDGHEARLCVAFGILEYGMPALSVADCDLTVMAHCYLIEANR